MGTYFINDFNRREIVRMSAALTCATIFSSSRLAAADALRRTPGQILGPFYPLKELPQTSDLTRLPGRAGRAFGPQALSAFDIVCVPFFEYARLCRSP